MENICSCLTKPSRPWITSWLEAAVVNSLWNAQDSTHSFVQNMSLIFWSLFWSPRPKFVNYYFYQISASPIPAAPPSLPLPVDDPQPWGVHVGECSTSQRRGGLDTAPILILLVAYSGFIPEDSWLLRVFFFNWEHEAVQVVVASHQHPNLHSGLMTVRYVLASGDCQDVSYLCSLSIWQSASHSK